jgi:hypothetical protein
MALVRTDVSEERMASIIRVTRISNVLFYIGLSIYGSPVSIVLFQDPPKKTMDVRFTVYAFQP